MAAILNNFIFSRSGTSKEVRRLSDFPIARREPRVYRRRKDDPKDNRAGNYSKWPPSTVKDTNDKGKQKFNLFSMSTYLRGGGGAPVQVREQ